MADAPPPPPGFEVDSAPAAAADEAPPPPPGFQMDSPGSGDAPAQPLQHPNSTPTLPMDKLPFGDQVALAQADNISEYQKYFAHRYGDKNVAMEWDPDGKPQLRVITPDGTYRVGGPAEDGPSFIARLAGDAPQIVGGTLGGIAGGMFGGPAGAVMGAGAGSMLAKEGVEGIKAAYGNLDKSPMDESSVLGEAFTQGAAGEMGGQLTGKAVSKALTFRLPKFITGATDESIAMTKAAHAAGGLPAYASMGPALTHLRRMAVVAEKLTGANVAQDQANMAFVKQELNKTLVGLGMPQAYVDAYLQEIDGPEYAISHRGIGEDLKESVRAHIATLDNSINQTAKVADDHITAQLKTANDKIDASKGGDLTGDVGKIVTSAKADFDKASGDLYDQVDQLVGKQKIIDTQRVATVAKKLVDDVKEASSTLVSQLAKDMSQKLGKQVSEEDAVMLQAFGLELPPDGKISIGAAQRLRTALRDKAGAKRDALTHNITQHDFGVLARAMDGAIQEAAEDPAARSAVNALNKADEFYKNGIRKFKDIKINNLISKLKAGAPPDPGKLVDILAEQGSSTRTGVLRDLIGPDVWKRVQGVHLQNFMKPYQVDIGGGQKEIDGYALMQGLAGRGDDMLQFEAIHGKGSIFEMQQIAELIATRQGKIDPSRLINGSPKDALVSMRAHMAARDEFMKKNALVILADDSKTGEEAYQWLVRPHGTAGGDESRLLEAARTFGTNSPQMMGLRQAALEELARNASIHAINKSGNRALANSLKAFSKTQRDLLFPDGAAKDMEHISDVIEFMFPFKSGVENDASMAGMHTGAVQERPLRERLYAQTVSYVTNFIALHPWVARTLITGREENSRLWMRNTAALFNKMTKTGTQIGDMERNRNQGEGQETPQPPMQMPGPGTLQ